jgi:hypothetical protein
MGRFYLGEICESLITIHPERRVEFNQPYERLLEGDSAGGQVSIKIGRQVDVWLLGRTLAHWVPVHTPQVGSAWS